MSPVRRAVLIHGGAVDARAWLPVVEALSQRQAWAAIAPDRPSDGELAALLTAGGVLGGASAGGGIALATATGAPPMIERVVVVGPLVPDAPVTLDDQRMAALSRAAAEGPDAYADAVLDDRWFAAGVSDERRQQLREMLVANAPTANANGTGSRRPWLPPALADRLGDIGPQVTVLLGELDDPANVAMSEFVAATVPQGSLHRVAASGHLVELAQPEAVAQAVRGEIGPWRDVRSVLLDELDAYCRTADRLDAQASSAIPQWSAAEVTAHLAHTFTRFTHLLETSRRGDIAAPFEVDELASVNAAALRESQPDSLALRAAASAFAHACAGPWEVMAHQRGPISVGLQQAFGVSELALHHHDLDQARRPPSPALDVLRSVWGSVLGELDARTDPWLDVLRCSGRRARPT